MFRPFRALEFLRILEDHPLGVVCRFSVCQDDEDDRFGRVDGWAEESMGDFELLPVTVE